jgi:hypothetical protein
MIVVVLQNPAPSDERRKNSNLEIRMMIEGITMDEADALGDAIKDFSLKMKRNHIMKAFQLELPAGSQQ